VRRRGDSEKIGRSKREGEAERYEYKEEETDIWAEKGEWKKWKGNG
jgi:hypothetical protein